MTEIMFSTFVTSLAVMLFFSMTSSWNVSEKRSGVRTDLLLDGSMALERVLRDLRDEMTDIAAVNHTIGKSTRNFVILADTNHDGTADSLKAWGIQPSDKNRDGLQDMIDLTGNGKKETPLWDFVAHSASSTVHMADAKWSSRVICRNLTAPWTTPDGQSTFRPFEFQGNNLAYDIGNDGKRDSKDPFEDDGKLTEVELGNIINGNGKIDHIAEESEITTIGLGLRLAQSSSIGEVESVIIYQGRIDPRNWNP